VKYSYIKVAVASLIGACRLFACMAMCIARAASDSVGVGTTGGWWFQTGAHNAAGDCSELTQLGPAVGTLQITESHC
jgi:hypothetical protein